MEWRGRFGQVLIANHWNSDFNWSNKISLNIIVYDTEKQL